MSSAASTEDVGRAETAARVGALFEQHGRMVYGICRAMLRDAHEAEDATQQAFLSAHRALLGGARVRDEGGWLATIARNECRARIAAGMRRPLSLGDEDLERIADPADEVRRREHAEALRIALADLPERQREAVVLRDLYGLRYGEVAKALGLSRAATETLLFRARRAMRQRLRPVVTTALVVPLSVQEGLAQALPGFTAASSAPIVAGAAGGGLLALFGGSTAAKFATAAVAVATVGAVSTAESERAGRDRARQDRLQGSSFVSTSPGAANSSGSSQARSDGRRGQSGSGDDDEGGSSGPGSDDGDGGSGSSGPGSDDRGTADDSSGGDESGDESSGRGSGSDDGSDDGSDTSGDDGPPSSSGSDDPVGDGSSSGSGSGDDGGDDSSDDPAADPEEPDSSGKGSGSSDSGGDNSGSGSSSGSGSGSGSSGKGSGDDDDGKPDD